MNMFNKGVLGCLLCVISLNTQAFTVNATFIGKELKWKNATAASGTDGFVLTDWTPVSGIPTTTEWIPANFVSKPADSVALSGPGGTVNMPITLKGVEYNWSSASADFNNNTISVETICNIDSVGGSIGIVASDDGSPCVSSQSISYSNSIAPFYFIRPIFNMDQTTFDSLFTGKEPGVYTGTIPATVRYYYRTNSNALSYFIIPQSLSFVIDYQPAILTDIQVTGDGVMEPTYDGVNHTVSGMTHFDMVASGVFTNGLKITFDANRAYEMKEASSESVIPYSVVCNACEDTQIVTDGTYQLGSIDTVVPVTGDRTNISFSFDISFNNVPGKDLVDGNYSDTFIVYFEENL